MQKFDLKILDDLGISMEFFRETTSPLDPKFDDFFIQCNGYFHVVPSNVKLVYDKKLKCHHLISTDSKNELGYMSNRSPVWIPSLNWTTIYSEIAYGATDDYYFPIVATNSYKLRSFLFQGPGINAEIIKFTKKRKCKNLI